VAETVNVGGGTSALERAFDLRDRFLERAGRPAEGVWAAPGRVNLIGEHTDYNDGFVLPIAIDRCAVVAIARRRDRVVRAWSMQQPDAAEVPLDAFQPGGSNGWATYVVAVGWALSRNGVDVPGFDLLVDSSVPMGSGLSSSAALECATAVALADVLDAESDPTALARLAHRAEVDGVGVPVGVMDQMASMLARAGRALLLDTRSLMFEHVPVETAPAGMTLLVIDTGAPRRLADGRYAERRAECRAAAAALDITALRDLSIERLESARTTLEPLLYRRARHVLTENARVQGFVDGLRARRWVELGDLLMRSHASLRDDFDVSSSRLDATVESAVSAGALGARMTGAGFGGCVLALVESRRVAAVRQAVERAFEERGWMMPTAWAVEPSDAARRLD
jgi:galactokinase